MAQDTMDSQISYKFCLLRYKNFKESSIEESKNIYTWDSATKTFKSVKPKHKFDFYKAKWHYVETYCDDENCAQEDIHVHHYSAQIAAFGETHKELQGFRNIYLPLDKMETESSDSEERFSSESDSEIDQESDSSFGKKANLLRGGIKPLLPSHTERNASEPLVLVENFSPQNNNNELTRKNNYRASNSSPNNLPIHNKKGTARRSLSSLMEDSTAKNVTERRSSLPLSSSRRSENEQVLGSANNIVPRPVNHFEQSRGNENASQSQQVSLKRLRETAFQLPKKYRTETGENIENLCRGNKKIFDVNEKNEVYLGLSYKCGKEVWDLMVGQTKPTIFGRNLAIALIPPIKLINRAVKLNSCDPQPITPRSPRKQLSKDFWTLYKYIFRWYLKKEKFSGPETAKLLAKSGTIVSKKISSLRALFVAGRKFREYLTIQDIEIGGTLQAEGDEEDSEDEI